MGPALLHSLILPALLAGATLTDTSTYANRATQELVARAMARHAAQDTTVRDYSAKLRYRVSFGFARRKWGDPLPVAVEEQDAQLSWQLPNDLRVDLLGRRSTSQLNGIDLSSTFSHPWFVPRTLGDSIRIFGASQTPSRAAPHPFAPGADRYYRYVAGDSLVLSTGGHSTTVEDIAVTPKFTKGAFITGRIWVDVHSGDVVRFTFRFVGTDLWSEPDRGTAKDSASATRGSEAVSRILELNADLEYSLQNNQHWMPYRQVISGKVSLPLGIDFGVPFEARTTFDDYSINSGHRVVFDAGFPRDTTPRGRNGGRLFAGGRGRGGPPPRVDSLRPRLDSAAGRTRFRNRTGYLAGGGRYEIHRPPPDSMRLYAGWGDSLVLQESVADRRRLQQAMADLGQMAEKLPRDMTGRPGVGFAWEKASDILRYNRVEGTTLSYGEHIPLPISFTDLYGTLRYGFGDERIMARVAMVRDAPSGKLVISGGRDLADVDPFTDGLSFGNSLHAIFSGHDDGAYLLAQGGQVSYEVARGAGTEMTLTARAEDERSVVNDARAFFPRIVGDDGYFPNSTPMRDGFAMGGSVRFEHVAPAVRWTVDASGIDVAGAGAARVAAEIRLPLLARGWLTARIKAGLAIGSDSVPQMALRAGGLNTVRGYDFGVTTGNTLWATQFDLSKPGRGAVRLVGFIDAGQAGDRNRFGSAPLLSGAGVGVSILGGIVRADLSQPLVNAAGHGVRFDLIFSGPR